jgi:hypothetical protein
VIWKVSGSQQKRWKAIAPPAYGSNSFSRYFAAFASFLSIALLPIS